MPCLRGGDALTRGRHVTVTPTATPPRRRVFSPSSIPESLCASPESKASRLPRWYVRGLAPCLAHRGRSTDACGVNAHQTEGGGRTAGGEEVADAQDAVSG